MAEHIIKRRIVWEKSGVSEIIGTILMLSITVVLFSGIITMVGSMPAPRQTFQVDLKCSLQPVNPDDWSQGVDVRVLHQGGQVMNPLWIKMYLTVDNVMLTKGVSDGMGSTDVNGDGKWGVGEWWILRVMGTEPEFSLPYVPLSTTTVFTITIIDQERNALVWHETIGQGGNDYGPIINRAWIDSDIATPQVDDPGPIGFERQFKVYADIVDPEGFDPVSGLNRSNLWVNVSSIFNSSTSPIQLVDVLDSRDAPNDNIYVAYCNGPSKIPIGYYMFIFNATDHTNYSSMFAARFPVGQIVGEKPQIVVKGDNPETGKYDYITFSNPEPTNGDTVEITATILNLGGKGANVDVWFYMDNIANPPINSVPKTILVPEVGQQDAKISWTASPGGVHMIIVYAEVSPSTVTGDFYDPDMTDNTNYTNISVMPKILLVDDDSHVNDLSTGDTVSFMRASLEAADFEYDYTVVGAGDGPGYDYGDYPLMEYDVVIWMTGYRITKTLTVSSVGWNDRTDDVANLQKYLTGNANGTVIDGLNGGSLWLISEGFWTEALTTPGLATFASTYLHINVLPVFTASLTPQIYGNESHPVTDYFADIPINTEERVAGTDTVHYWAYNDIPDKPRIALNDTAVDAANRKVFALSYDSDDYPADTILDSRMLAQTWGVSRISDTATQCQYAYKAILWLGDITSKFTQDVAISEQTIEPKTVFYKQQVTISFVVRNNGLNNYTTADNLWYLLRIIDMNGIDTIIPHLQRIDKLGTKSNNTLTISYNWIPQQIGYHRISIKIDPYNYIEESNELNNEISSYWGTGALNVQYRVLVVDDDTSHQSLNPDEAQAVRDALAYLNYSYEHYTVNMTDDGPAYQNGGNRTALSEYNAVIWVTGAHTDAPLRENDVTNISRYLDIGGSFWLVGTGLWASPHLTFGHFAINYLKVLNVDEDEGMAATLRGVEDDAVSHGMAYPCSGSTSADMLFPAAGGIGFTYQNAAMTRYNSVRYKGTTSTNTTVQYRSAVTAWPLSSIDEPLSQAEFVFMMLRWFDKPEERIEVRLSDIDIWITDDPNPHPQLGSGYVIQASVQNTGGTTGNVLVRFMDGKTQIGSDSISVSPGGWTTAEIIWVPLFAGDRTISVLLDPILQVPEIFPYSATAWSNNVATRQIYVYFFWDDMESGPGKWSHRSTITLINGEGPLEYFGNTAVTVNIEDEWDYAASEHISNSTDIGFYHTFDKSFWLQEPSGSTTTRRIPMDVGIIIDTSGSMDPPKIDDAKQAAKDFIALLTDEDRCTLWRFTGEAALQSRTFEYMSQTNRDSFNTTINPWTDTDWTPIWDTIGEAMSYMLANPRGTGTAGTDYIQVLVALTDGDDYGNEGNEDGSETYCPGSELGSTYLTSTWGRNAGLRWGDGPATFQNQDGIGGHDVRRYRNAYIWDDLAVSTRTGLIYSPMLVYTVGLGMNPHSDTGAEGWYPFTSEYDLWKIANTSGQMGLFGEYFYEDDSAGLSEIFQNIFESIIVQLGGEEQTKSSPPANSVMATIWSDGFESNNFNGWDGAPIADWAIRTNNLENDYGGSLVTVHGGQYCANARDANGVDNYLQKTVDMTGVTAAALTFWWDNQDIENNDERSYLSVWDGSWQTGIWYSTVNNDGDQRTNAGDWAQATVDLSGYNMVNNFIIRFTAPAGMDEDEGGVGANDDEFMLDDVELTGTIAVAPWIVSTFPADLAYDVAVNAGIVITFSEAMNPTTLAWTISPNPGGWTETWNPGNTVVTLSHAAAFTASTTYTVTVTNCNDAGGMAMTPYSPWTFTTVGPPTIVATTPANGATGVPLTQNVIIDFSKPMNTAAGMMTYTCTPNPGGWVAAWSNADRTVTLSHTMFAGLTSYTFQVTQALDTLGANIVPGAAANPWIFTTLVDNPPFIDDTVPVSGAVMVPVTQNIVITFTEAVIPASVTYTISPNPGGLVPTWSGGNTVLTIAHTNFAQSLMYTVSVDTAMDTTGNNLAPGPVPNPWTFRTYDPTPPYIISTTPSDQSTGVGLTQPIMIEFSEPMNTATVQASFSCAPNPYGWTYNWNSARTLLTARHYDFNQMVTYNCQVLNSAEDISGNNLIAGMKPNPWTFTTGISSSGGSNAGLAPEGENSNKSAVTKSMDLSDLDSASLEFWHKYNMVPGANGGVLMVGYKESAAGAYMWKYVVPSSAYTGNLRLNITSRVDSYGTFIQWGWNGISGRGTFTWEKVNLNLLNYVPDLTVAGYEYRSDVKVKFQYYQYGGGTGYGWYIDDVRVTVTRPNTAPTSTSQDLWHLTNAQAHSGSYCWGNVDPDYTDRMKPGIDNFLMSSPIDLTNARIAYLSAYVKFNLNYASGAPPDGFRVEISRDNGVTWEAVNLGVRSGWNISGTDNDADDGYPGDGKSYTGLNAGNYWVSLGSLTRVNVDLSGFSGSAIHIRFRVITNSDPAYLHSNNHNQFNPGFGGFYVDDVMVMGQTILG